MSAVVADTAIVLTQPEIPQLAEIAKQLDTFRGIAADLSAQAGRAVIASENDFAKGTDLLTLLKTHSDQVEGLRVAVKKPIDLFVKLIQDTFVPVKAQFDAANGVMRNKMIMFRNEQDRIVRVEQERQRKIQEEAAQQRAAELEKQGNTAAADAVLNRATAPLAAPQKTEARRGGLGGKAGTTDIWSAEVVNMREFLKSVLDGTTNFNLNDIEIKKIALNNLAKAVKVEGVKNGVKITKSSGLALRS